VPCDHGKIIAWDDKLNTLKKESECIVFFPSENPATVSLMFHGQVIFRWLGEVTGNISLRETIQKERPI